MVLGDEINFIEKGRNILREKERFVILKLKNCYDHFLDNYNTEARDSSFFLNMN